MLVGSKLVMVHDRAREIEKTLQMTKKRVTGMIHVPGE